MEEEKTKEKGENGRKQRKRRKEGEKEKKLCSKTLEPNLVRKKRKSIREICK